MVRVRFNPTDSLEPERGAMNEPIAFGKNTDWKVVFAAAGFFYASLSGVGWLFGEYILSRVGGHIEEHSTKVTGERNRLFADVERKADGAVSRIGELEQKCAVVQDWIKRDESRVDELDRWRTNCGQKMARVENQIERDLVDMKKIDDRLERIEDLVSKGRRE